MKRKCAILIFAATANLIAADWYKSGPSGYIGDRIAVGGREKSGWTLKAETGGNVETHTLYRNSKVYSVAVFTREDGRLISWEEKDAEGTVLSRIDYVYNSEGTPQISYITLNSEEDTPTYVDSQSFVNPDNSNLRSGFGRGDDWIITDMSNSGQPVNQTVYNEGKSTRTKNWKRAEDGRLLQTLVQDGNTTVDKQYNFAGNLILEEIKSENVLILTRSYMWEEGKLTRVEERGKRGTSIKEIEYNKNEISRETYITNDVTEKMIVYDSPTDRIENIYKNGIPVIRVYWKNNRRLREEYLLNGKVVRERDLSE
ncbi:MAG: hypothetical protein B0D92_03345 [Spirochaeta sp. LUC14_002_19_P3]|nr:MAG: hypothetical protein B0D92_03345 [Spirochaeta sp. LUC14_002_19_P3]